MKAKKVIGLVIYIILGIILLGCAFMTIAAAFKAGFAVNFEWHVVNNWGWAKFNLMTWGIILMCAACALLVIILATQDERRNKSKRSRI